MSIEISFVSRIQTPLKSVQLKQESLLLKEADWFYKNPRVGEKNKTDSEDTGRLSISPPHGQSPLFPL